MSGDVLIVTVILCLGYLLLTNLMYVGLVAVAAIESGVRRRETASQDYDVLAASRFTIPVSVIVAAYDEETAIVSTVESLLDLEYPEHEVIVVNDGSNDDTLHRLRRRSSSSRTRSSFAACSARKSRSGPSTAAPATTLTRKRCARACRGSRSAPGESGDKSRLFLWCADPMTFRF